MVSSRPATVFRVLIIVAANKPSVGEDLWRAICMTVQGTLALKDRKPTTPITLNNDSLEAELSCSLECCNHKQLELPSTPTPQPPILPPEILPLIFKNLVRNRYSPSGACAPSADVLTCAKVNRQWHLTAIPILYACPRLSTRKSLLKFVALIEGKQKDHCHGSAEQLWDYRELVKKVQFGAESEDEAMQLIHGEAGVDVQRQKKILGYCQSSLFRTLLSFPDCPKQRFFDPIFLRFLACPHIARIEETVSTDSSQQATNGVLQLLSAAIRKVKALSDFMNGGHIELFDTVTYLLDAFDGEQRPIWRISDSTNITPQTIRDARSFIHTHCKTFLNALSTATFLEAQYLAMAAGRVLDTYTGIHFSALQAAMGIDVLVLGPLLRVACRNETSKEPNHTSPPSPHRYDSQSVHQATLILTILRLIFHKPFSSSPYITPPQTPPPTPTAEPHTESHPLTRLLTNPTFLRDALTNFPPVGLNPETAELIAPHLHSLQLTLPSASTPGVSSGSGSIVQIHVGRFVGWLRKCLRWQEAGREMEPVKAVLRESMGRMEIFRSLQRQYGLVFID